MSKPSIGPPSRMSRAFPCGSPSITSKSTTSPRPLSAQRCASVPPIMPAPMSAIFFLAMTWSQTKKPGPAQARASGRSILLLRPTGEILEGGHEVASVQSPLHETQGIAHQCLVEAAIRDEDGERVLHILRPPGQDLHHDHVLGARHRHRHAVHLVTAGPPEGHPLRPGPREDDVEWETRRQMHQGDDARPRDEIVQAL